MENSVYRKNIDFVIIFLNPLQKRSPAFYSLSAYSAALVRNFIMFHIQPCPELKFEGISLNLWENSSGRSPP